MTKRHIAFYYIVLPGTAVLLPLVGGRLWSSALLLAVVALTAVTDALLKEE